jgi:hypothetical protein
MINSINKCRKTTPGAVETGLRFDFLEELIFALHYCCAIEATIKFHSIGQVDYTQAFQATSLNGAAMLRQRLSDTRTRP